MGMTNAEAATKWAKTQDVGKSSNGNLNYCGHVIRSYSTPIAAIITNPAGQSVALVTSEVYSVTTSGKHMPAVRSALRGANIPQYMAPEAVLIDAEHFDTAQDVFLRFGSTFTPAAFERLENNYHTHIVHAEKKASRARTSREFWERNASRLGRQWVELSSFLVSERV